MTPDKLRLKQATREMLRAMGGVEAAAGFCRVGKSVLSDAQNPNREDCFVAIDVVADLEPLGRERSGSPHVVHALCAAVGGAFVQLPDVPATGADLLALLGRQAKESGEMAT